MYKEALEYYEKALQLVPDYDYALNSREKIKELLKNNGNAMVEVSQTDYCY